MKQPFEDNDDMLQEAAIYRWLHACDDTTANRAVWRGWRLVPCRRAPATRRLAEVVKQKPATPPYSAAELGAARFVLNCGGAAAAAEKLGLGRTTLWRRLRRG